MKHLMITLLMLLPALTFAIEQGDVPVAINNSGKFVCLVNAEIGNGLGVNRSGEIVEIDLENAIKRFKRQIKRIATRISIAKSGGNFQLVNKLKRKRGKKRAIKDGMISCAYGEGSFNPENPGQPTNPTNPSEPVSDACSVVGDSNSLTARIINGTVCTVGDSPVVELDLLQNGQVVSGCSGTVVAPRVVITAGHCIEGMTSVRVRTGNGNFNSTRIDYHPSYDTTNTFQEYDIGVVQVGADLPTRVVDILNTNNLSVGEAGVIGGYGLDDNGNYGTLRAAPVNLSSFATGSIEIRYSGNGSNGNTCNGDSGGPIFLERNGQWVLAGATSWGINQNCGPGDNSYFMNITHPNVKSFVNGLVPGLID